MRSFIAHPLFQKIAPNGLWTKRGTMLLVLLVAYVSYAKFHLVLMSMLSLILTVSYSVTHPSLAGQYWRIEFVEYWVAGVAWAGAIVGLLIHFFQKQLRVPGAFKSVTLARDLAGTKDAGVRVGGSALVVLILVALLSPFLTPCGPLDQGDLVTTRLLKPLERGYATEIVPALDSSVATMGSIERHLLRANNYLLNRYVRFTYLPQTEDRGLSFAEDEDQRSTYSVIFFLGTDAVGRDVLSRLIYGARVSLGIGFAAVFAAVLIGSLVGFASGFFGGLIDKLLMRTVDLFLAIPGLFLVIAMVAFLGRSMLIVVLVLAATGWMGIARLVRAEVLKLREREFVLSAKLLGVSPVSIILTHMVPNVLPIILTAALLQLGNAVIAEASLSFLGLGVQPPTPTWGNMIGEATPYLRIAWWLGVFPGVALSLLVVSAHLVEEGIQRNLKGS